MSLPTFLQILTALYISFKSAVPVEIIMGLFFDAMYSIRGMSVISKEATLYAGKFNFSRKSVAVLSKGVEKKN